MTHLTLERLDDGRQYHFRPAGTCNGRPIYRFTDAREVAISGMRTTAGLRATRRGASLRAEGPAMMATGRPKGSGRGGRRNGAGRFA